MKTLFIFAIFLLFSTATFGFPWDPDFILKQHLATKSPYYPLGDLSDHAAAPATCVPVHFNLINRHGNRNPGDSDILEYQRIEAIVGSLGSRLAYPWMRTFKNPVPLEDEGKLVVKGQQEMYDCAKRYMEAFPEIFEKEYNSDVYFMRATQEQRAMMSGDAFAYSLFERRGSIGPDSYEPHFIQADTESQDNVLKYYDNCALYKELVDENSTANIETELYLETIIGSIAARLTTVVTTDRSWNISHEDVLAFHSICQTQAAIFDIENEFCTLFLQSELEALEYWEDLDDYYTKAYPYEINYSMTAPLLQDIVSAMTEVAKGNSRQKTNLRFAHSSTVVPLHAAFGLYDDNYLLRHDTPQSMIADRKYRTSVLSPMGTNFAFILYECGVGAQFRVKVLQNEKETVVAGCSTLYCPLDEFTNAYESYLTADFDTLCKNQ